MTSKLKAFWSSSASRDNWIVPIPATVEYEDGFSYVLLDKNLVGNLLPGWSGWFWHIHSGLPCRHHIGYQGTTNNLNQQKNFQQTVADLVEKRKGMGHQDWGFLEQWGENNFNHDYEGTKSVQFKITNIYRNYDEDGNKFMIMIFGFSHNKRQFFVSTQIGPSQ